MILQIQVPALLFPVVSLLFIAFTSRFLALAAVCRALLERFKTEQSPEIEIQLKNLLTRIKIIRATQIAALGSIILAALSMAAIFQEWNTTATWLFVSALSTLITSLSLCVVETYLSVDAIQAEFNRSGVNSP